MGIFGGFASLNPPYNSGHIFTADIAHLYKRQKSPHIVKNINGTGTYFLLSNNLEDIVTTPDKKINITINVKKFSYVFITYVLPEIKGR